jgi:hypothetical protein
VAHTPEQRDQLPLCGAKKKNGDTCRAFAGQGTNHFGVGRCKHHLGNSRNHEINATVQQAQQRMIKLGMPIEIRPHEALLSMLYMSSGHVAWLREEIAAMKDLGTSEGKVMVQMFGDERDRVAKIAEAALRAGVAERAVALAENYGAQLAEMFKAVFEDKELALTTKQQESLPAVLRRSLARFETSGTVITATAA